MDFKWNDVMEGNVNKTPWDLTSDPFICHHIFNSEDVIIVYIKNICSVYLAVGPRIPNEWDWFIQKQACFNMKIIFDCKYCTITTY